MYALLFGLWALFTPSNATLRQRLQRGILFSLPVIACILIVGSYNFARLGTVLASGYSPHEGFNQPPHLGLYGLLFSPYRGLFWYSPLLLAALPGWFMLKDRLLAHSTALLSGVTVLAFASWWSWHGGATWGPRFLVTITPLMTLWLAPLLTRKNWLSATTLGLFGASVAVQTLGAFYDYKIFIFDHQNANYWTGDVESIVTMLSPQVLYRLSASAITGHAQMLLNGTPPNFAWLRGGFDPLHVLAALLLIAMGILLAWRPRKRPLQIAAVVITVAAPLAVAAQQRNRPAPQTGRTLAAELAPAAPLLVTSCEFDHALYEVPRHVITMPAPTEQSTPRADAVWQHTQRTMQPRGLWLVDWFGPADPANWQARQLWQTAAFAGEKSVAGHRALYFRPGLDPSQPGGWQFDDIELTAYTATPAADGVQVALSWQATAPLTQNYSWFVHLLDADGQLIAQYDRQPHNGYTPTATWQPGDTLTDRLFFPHSDGATVRVGFLGPDGELLPVTTPDSSPADADFALLPVTD